ncbi:uncharacterized mitochondrial protein-like protein [Tanacetum coccineum]
MDLETAQTTTTAKLPILKQGEYDTRRLRIEQYFQVQDYALWDVIENGNSFKPAAKTTTYADGTSTTLIPCLITTKEKAQKENDVKARSMLLMTLPNEHLITFNHYKDAKTLFAAIQTRFGGFRKLNKSDLDTMSFDDLYNNFKIVEQEVKGTASSSSSSSSQNMAFVTASTQDNTANLSDATVYAFLASQQNRSQLVHEDLVQIHEDDLEEMDLKWQLALLSMRTRRWDICYGSFRGTLGNQDSRNRNQDNSRRTVNVEETSSKAMLAIDGTEEFQQPEFEGYGPKTSKIVSEDTSNEDRESPDALLVEELVSNDNFNHVPADCNYHQRERVVSENNYTRVNYNYSAKKAHSSAHRNIVPKVVLMKTGLRLLNTAMPVNTAHSKTTVYSARPMSHFSKSAQLIVKRTYQIRTALTNKNFSQKVNTAKGNFYTARPKAVNTARPNSAVVNAVRANHVNAIKASACWGGSLPKEDQVYVDSGCSRHVTGNMSYLSDFKEFDGGYVTFRGRAKGGTITSKETLKTADESQVLLKVPRKNNMYSVDMKNIVPNESLTCLVAKAILDESMLWHRRLGHNRVLVVKPHNKTPYELFRGKTPSLSFMRPFRCHVAILNTLDYLGKFDGNSDEGFFIGYSMNSKAFRVYNIRTRKVEENLHIRFLEDKPIIAGVGPKWLFDIDVLTKSMNYVPVVAGRKSNDYIGTEESIGASHSSKETGSSQDYLLMPLWKDGSLFNSSSKKASNDEPQPSSDAGKKDDEVTTARSNGYQTEPDMFSLGDNATLEATHADFFGDETEVDIANINYQHIHWCTKQEMTKTTNEQGFISAVYEEKTHEDLQNYLFACFLSQIEPKKVIQALTDPSWIEAMQDELLQFKLKQVWPLVDLPHGKRAIGFEDPEFPDRVYKVEKALYGLHQAPRACDILLVQVYVDDIIFGSTKKELCTEFEKLMHKKFQMSSMGELTFFLGLQVTQKDDGIFISQDKFAHNKHLILENSHILIARIDMLTSEVLIDWECCWPNFLLDKQSSMVRFGNTNCGVC